MTVTATLYDTIADAKAAIDELTDTVGVALSVVRVGIHSRVLVVTYPAAGAADAMTAAEIMTAINASTEVIDAARVHTDIARTADITKAAVGLFVAAAESEPTAGAVGDVWIVTT